MYIYTKTQTIVCAWICQWLLLSNDDDVDDVCITHSLHNQMVIMRVGWKIHSYAN